ncbi:MAG: SDR family NAD(P)-dependent oxidoreductase [Gemmatimonadaceae bacterium]
MKREKLTVLITGGSRGIGLELAKQFAAHGHDLILVARHRDALEAAAGILEGKHGVKVTVMSFDLADPQCAQRLFDAVTSEGLQVDVLVNNAGFGHGGEFAETDLSAELDMIQVNVASLVHLTKLFLQPMILRRSGRILNVGSTAGFHPGPLHSIYFATKAFILSFSQAIDEELRNTGVTVTCLTPGATATNFAERANLSNTVLFNMTGVADAEDVARYGYAATMRGERLAIPGIKNKFVAQAGRLIPRAIATTLARKVQENR